MVVKIMAVVLQWMESRHTSQTDSVGLGNGLDIGVRESEESKKKKKNPYVSGMNNYWNGDKLILKGVGKRDQWFNFRHLKLLKGNV